MAAAWQRDAKGITLIAPPITSPAGAGPPTGYRGCTGADPGRTDQQPLQHHPPKCARARARVLCRCIQASPGRRRTAQITYRGRTYRDVPTRAHTEHTWRGHGRHAHAGVDRDDPGAARAADRPLPRPRRPSSRVWSRLRIIGTSRIRTISKAVCCPGRSSRSRAANGGSRDGPAACV